MIETGVLVNAANDEVILWHLPPGRTSGSIPDSRSLWDAIWANRDLPLGFAHSHPGGGIPHPSHEDSTTFDAIERALGKALVWWIMSRDSMVQVARDIETGRFASGLEQDLILHGCRPSYCVKKIPACTPEHCEVKWVRELWRLSYKENQDG